MEPAQTRVPWRTPEEQKCFPIRAICETSAAHRETMLQKGLTRFALDGLQWLPPMRADPHSDSDQGFRCLPRTVAAAYDNQQASARGAGPTSSAAVASSSGSSSATAVAMLPDVQPLQQAAMAVAPALQSLQQAPMAITLAPLPLHQPLQQAPVPATVTANISDTAVEQAQFREPVSSSNSGTKDASWVRPCCEVNPYMCASARSETSHSAKCIGFLFVHVYSLRKGFGTLSPSV